MTQTLTPEAMQDIYEAAVREEATGNPDESGEEAFDLLCLLDAAGGTGATIRKLIDMVRAANRQAQPVAFTSPAQLLKYPNEQKETYGQYSEKFCVPLFTTPPAPAVPDEMTGSIAMTQYRIKPSNYKQWVKGYNACRAAMLAQPVSQGNKLQDDTRRMDWLVSHRVEVRKPLVYGSHAMFCAQQVSDDDEEHKTDLREQIDAAMLAAPEGGNG